MIRGRRFYARDRELAPGGPDLGEELPWLPPRTAELEVAPGLPAYRPVPEGVEEPLEKPLSRFLARTRDRQGVRHEAVSNEIREQMRALGYVEGD